MWSRLTERARAMHERFPRATAVVGTLWQKVRDEPLVGIAFSVLLHVALIVLVVYLGGPSQTYTTKRGEPLFVELPDPKDQAPRGNPAAREPGPPAAPLPEAPPPAVAKAEPATPKAAPPAPKATPPAAKAQPPAPKSSPPAPKAVEKPPEPQRVASAPPPEPVRERPAPPADKPAPKPPEPPAPEAKVPLPTPPPETRPAPPSPPPVQEARPAPPAETRPTPPAPAPEARPAPPAPPQDVRPPPAAPPTTSEPARAGAPGPHVALVPPTTRDPVFDVRALGRGGGAGGRGEGRAGIEGEPIPLDSRDPKYSDYLDRIRRMIKERWGYPCVKNPLSNQCEYKSAQLVIEFGIAKDGKVPFVNVLRTSGFSIYDDYAVNAIKLASPFPPVPDSLSKKGFPIMATFNYIVDSSLVNTLR